MTQTRKQDARNKCKYNVHLHQWCVTVALGHDLRSKGDGREVNKDKHSRGVLERR